MINTVQGAIKASKLGLTLMHEHILWAWIGEARNKFPAEKVVEMILPKLKEIKEYGLDTIVEPTTEGAGRDPFLLKEISEKSGLQIITNCGVWDGLDYKGIYVPKELYEFTANEIAAKWIDEFENGIDATNVKPGFIKLGIGDDGYLTGFHKKVLDAAILTSKETGLTIQAHICSSDSAKEVVSILEENDFPLHKFIWTHADFAFDDKTIIELARKGIWVETDWQPAKPIDYTWFVKLINQMDEFNLLDQLLISQDVGGFHDGNLSPYNKLFDAFIPFCLENGIGKSVFDQILIENPARALDLSI